MRRLFTILTLCILATSLHAQPRNCRDAMQEGLFKQKHKSLSLQRNENSKLGLAISLVNSNCFTADQVKRLALLFNHDDSRLEFATKAYNNTIDKENFYYVYDAFVNFSSVFMLHDQINQNNYNDNDNYYPNQPDWDNEYAQLNYPDYNNYRGPSNCNFPVNENEFRRLTRQINHNANEQNKLNRFMQIVENNCMSVSQVMKIATLLDNEYNRLTLVERAIPSIYDLANLQFGMQLFTLAQTRNEYNRLLQQNMGNAPQCQVTDMQLRDMIQAIKKQNMDNAKLSQAKTILQTNPCFITVQIRDIMKAFNFDNGKLDLAKFAWDYTIDKENYYKLMDELTFSTNKEDLSKFIKSRLQNKTPNHVLIKP
jgi:hypothetical protein